MLAALILGTVTVEAQVPRPGNVPQHVLDAVPIEVIRGDQAASRGGFALALKEYKAAAERVGTNPSIEVRAAPARFGLNRCPEGLHQAEPHRTDPAWTAQTSALAAACFARRGDYGEAVYWQEEAVLLELGEARRWVMLGVFRARQGDELGAAEAFAEAELLDPDTPALQSARGSLALDRGDLDALEEACRRLDAEPAGHPMADLLRARMYLDLGEPELAGAHALRARARGSSPAITATLVEATRRSGSQDIAERMLSMLPAPVREAPELLAVQARLAVDTGRFDEAQVWVDRALALDPTRLDNLGAAWYVAQARGHANEAHRLERLWRDSGPSPLRALEQYEPMPW